jgi:TolB-like protein/Tfp pilus assembly protein PilF
VSFIAELKQRKVFRVAMVYLVVAWVAIQAASIALPAFDAPPWTLRVVILLFALGFPLALLLTWVLDLTPEGIRVATGKVGNKRMAGIAAGLIALALGWYFLGQPALRQQAIAGERSIAVLPFVNMSGDKDNEYFSDGLAETTLDMLAQLKDLKVIARTSSFAFKGKQADMREIGKALGAAHLLEGSVQQAGDTVRITAQLIRVSDGSHLWSKRFDRKLADVFAIQDEIATEVVNAIQGALPAVQQARLVRKRTDNVRAYDEYLKGIALLPDRNTTKLRAALVHFERAIELDPAYARAYAMAGTAASLLRTYGDDSEQTARKIPRYIDRALELAPDLGEAWAARGAQLEQVRDLRNAERAYLRSVELAPGYATGYQWLGEFYQDQLGEMDKALPLLERATTLDPLSPIIQKEYAVGLAAVQRLDEAERILDRLLQAHPRFAVGHEKLALLRMQRGDLSGALRAIETAIRLDPEVVYFPITRCTAFLRFRAMQAAKRCADDLLQRWTGEKADNVRLRWLMEQGEHQQALALIERMPTPSPFEKAGVLFNLGRYEEAEAELRQMFEKSGFPLTELQTPPKATSPYVEDLVFVGAIRLLKGEREAGTALLEEAAKRAAALPAGSGDFARNWHDVAALALLGRHQAACAAYRSSVEAGMFTDYDFAERMPVLADFRKQPCYPQVVALARERAEAQIDKARAAGLLEG